MHIEFVALIAALLIEDNILVHAALTKNSDGFRGHLHFSEMIFV